MWKSDEKKCCFFSNNTWHLTILKQIMKNWYLIWRTLEKIWWYTDSSWQGQPLSFHLVPSFSNTVLVLLKRWSLHIKLINPLITFLCFQCQVAPLYMVIGALGKEMSGLPALSPLLCILSAALWHYLSHHRGGEQRFQPHCAGWPKLASLGEGVIGAEISLPLHGCLQSQSPAQLLREFV